MGGASAGTMTKPRPARGFVVFKWLVYGLLAANVALYARHGTRTEMLDTGAWLLLLMLFEWETGGWPLPRAARPVLHFLRFGAAAVVVWACVGYGLAREWLDFANACAWLGVVAVLELEVRVPQDALWLHRVRRVVAFVLDAGLLAFAGAWAAIGLRAGDAAAAWLDAWDALLWLVAFGVIELNVFRSPAHLPR